MFENQIVPDTGLSVNATVDRIVGELSGKACGEGYKCKCPAHDDRTPSLSVSVKNDKLLVHCHAGCEQSEVIAALQRLRLWPDSVLNDHRKPDADIIYKYQDTAGNVVFEKIRKPGKKFLSRKPSGEWNIKGIEPPLYRLPQVLAAKKSGQTIYFVEGEKDADNCAARGLAATCNYDGASGRWRNSYNEYLTKAKVVIIPDNDEAGRRHAQDIYNGLKGVAASVQIINLPDLPEKGDISDWFTNGGTVDELDLLAAQQSQPLIRVIDGNKFLALEIPPREELLSPWLTKQSLAMIYSWRGTGKTLVSMGIAIAVATGSQFLKWSASTARPVLYIDGEMPSKVLQERIIFASQGKDLGQLKIITPDLQDGSMPDLSTKAGQELINGVADDSELIIVDNISCLVRGQGKENDAESWLSVQDWALSMRQKGKSVLFVHHSGKSGAQRGTSKREDLLDSVIYLEKPKPYNPADGAVFVVNFEKARGLYGDAVEPFMACLETSNGFPFDSTHKWTVTSLEQSLEDRVLALRGEGLNQTEIAKELAVHKSSVSRALKRVNES